MQTGYEGGDQRIGNAVFGNFLNGFSCPLLLCDNYSEGINGGDVRIEFNQEPASWDLSSKPMAQCSLTITSDTPMMYAGIDRMKGAFSCPLLPSSSPNHTQRPVVVSSGRIDVAIIVES